MLFPAYIYQAVIAGFWEKGDGLYSGAVCENVEEIIEFFGTEWQVKDLYREANINAAVRIDW